MSRTKQEVETMTCAVCGKDKAWTDGFPTRTYAECWQCVWKAHSAKEHPKKTKRRLRWVEIDA